MKSPRSLIALVVCIAAGFAGRAYGGAPQPDTRQGDFAHICKGGSGKGQPCTLASEDVDCPGSACVVQALSPAIKGTLTVIAHDSVTDWSTGVAANRALTLMLEVKAPDGSAQMLAATYQNLADPTAPPTALSNVVAIDMDESAVADLSAAVGGLLFASPESTLAAQLQALFASTGTPVIVAATDRRVEFADHTGDGLATVLRFKVKIQFVTPA
jgi:hypothetical protein